MNKTKALLIAINKLDDMLLLQYDEFNYKAKELLTEMLCQVSNEPKEQV